MKYAILIELILAAVAHAAEPPRFEVVNKTIPAFEVVNKTGPAAPAQVWVREYWPGYGWVQVLREPMKGVSATATPKGQGTTRTTSVTGAGVASTSSSDSTGTVRTLTGVTPAATSGGTDCPPGQP